MTYLRHYLYARVWKGWEQDISVQYARNMTRAAHRTRVERFGKALWNWL